jgi:hypothetical protein
MHGYIICEVRMQVKGSGGTANSLEKKAVVGEK